MDYNKIGNFIMAERKAKNLTQAKLAEKLFISEKTVSKWETGKGIPDTGSLTKLCDIFGVGINEILNGERLKEENYINKAEEKLLELQKEKEQTHKKILLFEIIFGIILVFSFATIFCMCAYAIEKSQIYVLPIILMVVSFIMLVVGVGACLIMEQKAGYYVCAHCGHKYVPTFKQVLWAMHCGRTRYLKCPHCNKKSWNKKVVK